MFPSTKSIMALLQRRRNPQSAVVGLLLVLVSLGVVSAFAQQAKPKTIRLVIDYGDGVEKHFTALPWSEGMTALDAMNRAKASPHGITFKYSGKGASAFLSKIDDLENEGGIANGKNWIYRVNDKLATKGLGIYKLRPSDVVKWCFEAFKL